MGRLLEKSVVGFNWLFVRISLRQRVVFAAVTSMNSFQNHRGKLCGFKSKPVAFKFNKNLQRIPISLQQETVFAAVAAFILRSSRLRALATAIAFAVPPANPWPSCLST